MTVLRAKDIAKMEASERKSKEKELRLELVKATVSARKSGTKTKEIKKALARLATFQRAAQQEASNK